MSSFFDKLKKGMGVEDLIEEDLKEEEEKEEGEREEDLKEEKEKEATEETEEEMSELTPKKKIKKKNKPIKVKKINIQEEVLEQELKEKKEEPEEILEEKEEERKLNKLSPSFVDTQEKEWSSFNKEEEGQLAIDVYQTEKSLIIQSTIAGVKPENLDISIERDIVTIKGNREKPLKERCDYFIQECFWGPFSREIIVPVEVDPEKARAEMKENVLTIEMPKILREKKRKILIRG